MAAARFSAYHLGVMISNEFPSTQNSAWLIEAEVAACVLAVSIIAFTLMLGHTLWRSLTRK